VKKIFLAALLALPLAATASRAEDGCNWGFCFSGAAIPACRMNLHFSNPCCQPGSGGGCFGPPPFAPWYLYYPYEAHFQTPAPTGYPYWPMPQTPPPGTFGYGGPPVSPASYAPQAPYYWYR
jgi:hypothetical protein